MLRRLHFYENVRSGQFSNSIERYIEIMVPFIKNRSTTSKKLKMSYFMESV